VLQLLRNEKDLLVDLLVFLLVILNLLIERGYFFGYFYVHGAPNPPHLILVYFLDVADSFEDVGYVVDPTLLDAEFPRGLVYIEDEVLPALYQFDESLGE
jgi:hypothetical protein